MKYRFVCLEVFSTRCNVEAILFDKSDENIRKELETEVCVLLISWLSKTTAPLKREICDNFISYKYILFLEFLNMYIWLLSLRVVIN